MADLDRGLEHPLIGKQYWCHLPGDASLWTVGTIEKVFKGQVTFLRQHAPGSVHDTKVVVEESQVAKMEPVLHVDDIQYPLETDDLVSLRDPREATMLHVLRERYGADSIFTNIGPVLTVINPYKQVQCCKAASLHGLSRLEPEALPSHAFKIAAAAYSGLVEESPGCPQSILVSGESGAGKTETTKLLVACLALVSNSSGAIVESALESGYALRMRPGARKGAGIIKGGGARTGEGVRMEGGRVQGDESAGPAAFAVCARAPRCACLTRCSRWPRFPCAQAAPRGLWQRADRVQPQLLALWQVVRGAL